MKEYVTEKSIKALITRGLGHDPDLTLFDNPVGMLWTGTPQDHKPNESVTLINPRRMPAGLGKGSTDIVGRLTVIITPEMVGLPVAIFCGLEVKRPGEQLKEHQKNWIDQLVKAGGRAGRVDSVESARRVIYG